MLSNKFDLTKLDNDEFSQYLDEINNIVLSESQTLEKYNSKERLKCF